MIADHWQILTVLIILMIAGGGGILAMVRWSLNRAQENTDRCITALSDRIKSNQELERDLLKLKAELPVEYVRKEDFIRHEVVINAKLDRIYERMQGGGQSQCR